MKYFDIKSVVEAYKGFQNCMTNKSWGYLALLKGCDDCIRPFIPYEVNVDAVSNFLEGIFNLSQTKKQYNGGRSLYVVFSNKWEKYFNDEGKTSPNIFDVAVWAYRRKPFPDNVTREDIINEFSKEFNISSNIIKDSFNIKAKEISFTSTLYSELSLKSELGKIGVDVSKENIDAKKGSVVASPGEISRGPFVQTLYAGLDITDYVLILQSNYNVLYGGKSSGESNKDKKQYPLQQIFYGAPGTGKSHKVKYDERVKAADEKNLVFRTTFHPDSDYSTFVGAYKPTMKPVPNQYKAVAGKDEEITYEFVPQAFLQAYIAAWNNQEENVFLVVEEINRGNCAQIFGDLFQLLDRNDDGYSEYPIKADIDLAKYLYSGKDENGKEVLMNKDGIKDGKLKLPKNLYIWATMNTSDQSLFPIDSAFKRRWDWKYIKIKKGKDKNDNELDWRIVVKDKDKNIVKINDKESLSWWDFIQKINEIIASMTSSADKQLGYFFCKADSEGKIDAKTFVNKVIFYLWNDVFKDYGFEEPTLFRYKDEKEGKEKELTFPDFYDEDGEDVNTERLKGFVEAVMNWQKNKEEQK